MNTDITTATQTVTSAGAIPGSLDTSALTGKYAVKLRFGLTTGVAVVALEDTASSGTPFDDAIQVAVFHIKGATVREGITDSRQDYQIRGTRFGAANTKLRFNVLEIAGGGTLTAYGWLEQ